MTLSFNINKIPVTQKHHGDSGVKAEFKEP